MKAMKIAALTMLVVAGLSNHAAAQVDINQATVEQLDSLPGIGPKKAEAITKDRAANGPYKSMQELDRVPGIGPKIINGIGPAGCVQCGPAPAPQYEELKSEE